MPRKPKLYALKMKASKEEHELIYKIAVRAVKEAAELGRHDVDLLTMEMDIIACHLNGCPLLLSELLEADGYDFIHDVFGIRRHINRKTGKLMDFFDPRYSVPESELAKAKMEASHAI